MAKYDDKEDFKIFHKEFINETWRSIATHEWKRNQWFEILWNVVDARKQPLNNLEIDLLKVYEFEDTEHKNLQLSIELLFATCQLSGNK
jgi:hypothetical protein